MRLPNGGQRHALEDDVGDAAVGRRVAGAFLGLDQAVGELVVAAGVEAIGDGGEVELLAVGPDAAEPGDRAFGEGDGEVGEVAVLDAGARLAACALPPLPPPLLLRGWTTSSSRLVAQMIWPPRRARP